jgi:tRNA (cmo5U34)-methyltransferase
MTQWDEDCSRTFIRYAPLFVPDREEQIDTFYRLLPLDRPLRLLELSCGDGTLAETLLTRLPQVELRGLDLSVEMRAQAAQRCARFGERFAVAEYNIAAPDWRTAVPTYDAILSSLAIHHLDGPGKAALYADLFRMLRPGGLLIIADLVEPTTEQGRALAARRWDETVQRHSQAQLDSDAGFHAFQESKWNLFRYPDPEVDKPSPLFAQLRWLAAAGFQDIDLHYFRAGHALFSGTKGDS